MVSQGDEGGLARMKRIGNSKEPTIQRMLDIASNLREKFHKYFAIQLSTDAYSSGNTVYQFWCYEENRGGEHLDSWAEVLAWYRGRMNE